MHLIKEHRTCRECGGTWVKTKVQKANGHNEWIDGETHCPFCSRTRSYSSLEALPKKKDWVDDFPEVGLETILLPEFAIFVWDEKPCT
jgi:hypothetical protein